MIEQGNSSDGKSFLAGYRAMAKPKCHWNDSEYFGFELIQSILTLFLYSGCADDSRNLLLGLRVHVSQLDIVFLKVEIY